MIKKIGYFKVPPRYDIDVYSNIDNFISAVDSEMSREGYILLVLEPGDAAQYEFLLIGCGDSLAVASPPHGWSVIGGTKDITPRYIEEKTGLKINPYTLGVICQIIAQVYNTGELYYDWVKSIPVEKVTPGDTDGKTE